MMDLPAPHGDKLVALLINDKLPPGDRERVAETVERYNNWLEELRGAGGNRDEVVQQLVGALNAYKRYVDLDLIFDSPDDFLYRQKGQLKLDNTVVEEFLPWLILKTLPEQIQDRGVLLGPTNCFSHLRFDSDVRVIRPGASMAIRSKDQDFAISRRLFIQASHQADFRDAVREETSLAFVAAEIKTNLDKTMFQEAAATAYDLKLAVPNARYYLLCEWLDMTPISTSVTAIEKVIILRRGKRLASNVRKRFSTVDGRRAVREAHARYLEENPYSVESFSLFVNEVAEIMTDTGEDEDAVIQRGWF